MQNGHSIFRFIYLCTQMMIHAVIKMIEDDLSQLYSREEIKSFISLLFEHQLGLSRLNAHLRQFEQIPDAKLTEINQIVDRLKNYEPIQYILGETEFYSLRFKVSPAVLIPRPETEELVEWILNDYPGGRHTMLDIGTGSGCIPITVAKNRPEFLVEGWDISEDALKIARENAEKNEVKVNFSKVDILKMRDSPTIKMYDIIISNPPYVTRSEQLSMLRNVTEFEPHLALFVPDNDPLIFYREITDLAVNHLNPGGRLYFEINEKKGDDLVDLLNNKHFNNIMIRKDISGRDRMINCEL